MNFNRIHEYNDTFKRLTTNYCKDLNFIKQKVGKNISIYAGIFNNKHSIAIKSKDTEISLKNTSKISIYKQDFDEEKAFIFVLEDINLLSIFLSFAVDLENVLDEDINANFKQIYDRYLYWGKMFQFIGQDITENKILGLINEINFMIEYLIPKVGVNKAINAWTGSSMLHKDFALDTGVWYEVKAISIGNSRVTINSLEQLDSSELGYLIISEYEKTSITNYSAINLYSVVMKLESLMVENNISEEFYYNLLKLGIGAHEVFDVKSYINGFKYILHNTRIFKVVEDFPKLTRNILPKAIISAKYEIQLDLLQEFEIEYV